MMAMAMSMKAERAMVPVEGGDSEVSVTVNGKIELVK
jgi:predicted secreted protein